MTWRHTEAGKEMNRPSKDGIFIDGPLSAEDIKHIIEELLEELVELAKAGEER
jgi:hypothetical protein